MRTAEVAPLTSCVRRINSAPPRRTARSPGQPKDNPDPMPSDRADLGQAVMPVVSLVLARSVAQAGARLAGGAAGAVAAAFWRGTLGGQTVVDRQLQLLTFWPNLDG